MLKMSQVNYIRDLSNSGYRIAEISKKLKLDRKTVRKYLSQEDFSPTPPVKYPVPSKLDPYKPKILEWLAEDQHVCQGLRNIFEYIGVKACQMGLKTKFFSVIELVLKLSEARKQGTLEKLVKDLQKQDLLILDEWGYVPVDRDGSQMLFRIVSDSYERKSLILTTNLEFSKWGSVFTDEQMAAAMIDRLAHHGHLLMAGGRSYRMEHALMRQDAVVEPAS